MSTRITKAELIAELKAAQARIAEFEHALGPRGGSAELGNFSAVEDALRKSQSLLAEVQQIGHIGHIEWSKTGKLLSCSDEMYEILGLPRGTVVNQHTIADMMDPDERKRLEEEDCQAFSHRRDIDYEYRIRRADGNERWLHQHSKVVYDEQGVPIRMIAIFQDVTEYKQAEEELQFRTARYRMAQTISHVGSWEYNLQTTHFWGSPEAKRIYGFDPDQADFSVDDVENCIPERERVHQALVDLIEAGKPYNLEFEIHPRDSSKPRIISSIAELQRDKHGNPFVVGVIQDITERKQVEQKLRESEERFSRIFRASPIGIILTQLEDGRILDVNNAFLEMFGREREKVVGNTTLALNFFPNPVDRTRLVSKLSERGRILGEETGFRHSSGKLGILYISAEVINLPNGQALLSMMVDITARRQAEQAIRLSEEKWRTLFETCPVGIALTTAQGEFLDANPAYLAQLGYTRDELAKKRYEDITPSKWRGQEAQNVAHLKASGMPIYFEKEHIRKDGTVFPVALTGWVIRDESGAPRTMGVFVQDITERKQAEEALHESESRYRLLVETSIEGIWSMDREHRTTYVNQSMADMLGYEPSEMLGRKVEEFFFQEDMQFHQTRMEKRHSGQDEVYERRFRRRDGSQLWTMVSARAQKDSQGNFNGSFAMFTDITERKRAEEALNKSQALLTEAQRIGRIGHMEWSEGNQVLTCSEEIYSILGLPRETVITQETVAAMMTEEERDRIQRLDMQALQQRQDMDYEYRLCRKDGSERWLHQMGKITYGENGAPVRMMAIIQDITEGKQAEEILRESRSRIEMALKGANAAMWDWNVQTGATVFNERWAEMIGYALEELEPVSIQTWRELCHPDDLKLSDLMLQRHFAGETEYYECETRMRHKNGSWVWVIDRGRVMEWDTDCTPRRMFGTQLDITERKREERYTQARLRLANLSYETLDMDTLMRTMLDEAEALTDSQIAFFHFVDDDQNTIRLQAWSTNTLESLCTAEGKGQHYPVEQAGVWADGIRSGEPRIYNDYASLPQRRGLPEGHAPVTRLISLPIKRKNLVVAAIGVGNKPTDYNEHDLEMVKRLAEDAFDIVLRKRAEEALRESERKLSTLLSNLIGFAYRCRNDHNWSMTYLSGGCAAITGYLPEDLIENHTLAYNDLIHPSDREMVWETIQKALNVRASYQIEYRIVTREGVEKWVWEQGLGIFEGDDLKALEGFITDITDRKRAEDALLESEEKYRGLMESLDSVVANVDINGVFLYMNDTAAEQLGGVPAQFIGKTMYELFPEYTASLQMRDIHTVFDTDQGMVFENPSLVNGKSRWYRTSIQPLHEENGQVVSVLINSTDIHDLKTAQQELQELNRTLEDRVKQRTAEVQDLYDNAPTGYHSLDVNGNFVLVNQTELNWLGYTREELVGHAALEFLTEESKNTFRENFPLFLRRGWLKDLELEFVCKDGSVLPVSLSATAIRDGAGSLVMSRSTLFDITERKQAENELKRNVNFTSALLNSVPTPVFYKDRDGRYLGCNRAFTELTGKTPEEIIGKLPHQIWDAEQADIYRQKDIELIQNGERQVYESTIKDKDGKIRPVIFVKNAFLDESGKPAGLVGAFVDITEREESERILRESEETYRALFEHSNDAIFLMSAADGAFVKVNPRCAELLGYPAEELIGKNSTEFVDPLETEDSQDRWSKLFSGERMAAYERRMVRNGGEIVETDINLNLIRDAAGKPVLVQSVVRDITARKQAERALRESEEQNRLLFEESPVPIALLDEAGHIIHANHAYELLTGYPRSDLYGKTSEEVGLVDAQVINNLTEAMLEAMSKQENFAIMEHPLTSADGTRRIVESRIYLLQINSINQILVTSNDITPHKRAEETLRLANRELERALRLKDEFLANMSHELRTPLNAILGISESLMEQIAGPLNDKQLKYTQTVHESGQHLLTLINDVLDLAKINAGKVELEMSRVEAPTIAQSCLRLVRELAQKKGLELTLDLDPAVSLFLADERRLKQMIVNLLSNAVKFTPSGGRVGLQIRGDASNRILHFSVWDTGIGIHPDEIQYLFQPFVQLNAGLARDAQGTGLGLVLVSQMARLHGGSVRVESQPGQGSRFTISIPWRAAAQTGSLSRAAQPNHSPAPAPEGNQRPTILLVEDTEAVSMLIHDYLESHGYHVFVARNGFEGITQAQQLHPKLILMDVMMPEMDGLETTRRLRSLPGFEHTPIIALTALAMPGDRDRCLAAGMNDYLAKPVKLSEVLEIVQRYEPRHPTDNS